jgi:hypothetical protein
MKTTQQLQNLRSRRQPRNITHDLLRRRRVRGYAIVIILTLVGLAGYQVKSQNNSSYNQFDLVDKNGIIRKPTDYRDRYQALGVFSVADLNGGVEMHYTYASPGTAEYYRKNGKFADGSVLVKEVFGSDHAKLTTGDVHGLRNEGLVHHDQRRKRTLSRQPIVGRWMGMGAPQL